MAATHDGNELEVCVKCELPIHSECAKSYLFHVLKLTKKHIGKRDLHSLTLCPNCAQVEFPFQNCNTCKQHSTMRGKVSLLKARCLKCSLGVHMKKECSVFRNGAVVCAFLSCLYIRLYIYTPTYDRVHLPVL